MSCGQCGALDVMSSAEGLLVRGGRAERLLGRHGRASALRLGDVVNTSVVVVVVRRDVVLLVLRGRERAGAVFAVLERLARGNRDKHERDDERDEGDPADDDVGDDRGLVLVGELFTSRLEERLDDGRRESGCGQLAGLGRGDVLRRGVVG